MKSYSKTNNLFFILIFSLVTSSTIKFVQSIEEDGSLLYEDPSTCNKKRNETWSWLTLGCVKCQTSQMDSPNYCSCIDYEERLALKRSDRSPTNVAQQCMSICAANSTMLYNSGGCISCSHLNPFEPSTGKCRHCPLGHIEVAYDEDGSLKYELDCIQCAAGFEPSPSFQSCIPCHTSFIPGSNGTCGCPEFSHSIYGGICFRNDDLKDPVFDRKNAYKIEYEKSKVESQLFRENLVAAIFLCQNSANQTACQMLGNMCTLNMHSFTSEESSVCRLFRTVLQTHPRAPMPKLYYSDIEAPSVLIRPTTIPNTHNTDYSSPSSSRINITLARFSFDGAFIGLSNLEDLIPCRESKSVLQSARNFGTTFRTKCDFTLKDFWGLKMEFLDPYLSYEDSKGRHLYPLPVKIQNFRRNGENLNTQDDKYQWQLVRRFFIVDSISNNESQEKLKVVRYLKSLHISVQLQNSKEAGRIYVPLLTLSYEEINAEVFAKNQDVEFEYSVTYFMDMSRSIEDVKISIGVLSALAVLWSAIQTWSWNRRSGRAEIDIGTILDLLITSCGNLADAFFIVCFCTGLFWFVFFKKQVAVHVFLPDQFQEKLVRDLLISAFVLKIVKIIQLIWRQSNIDIFFVDWEKPKIRSGVVCNVPPSINTKNLNPGESHGQNKSEKNALSSEENVSIWRSYFIANEWNEIQTLRKIHIATQIILTIFFLEVVGFKSWGLNWPNGDLTPDQKIIQNIPYSTSARFVVATLVFGLIGILQWIFRLGIYERYFENIIQNFVDLCTLGNVSVFILSAKQHGYYIHGRSVHGFADTDMQTMIEQLNREEEDLCSRRGLLPQTDQQTFLISIPSTFRSVYDQVLQPLYASSVLNTGLFTKGRQLETLSKSKSSTGGIGMNLAKPTANMLNLSIHAYHSMNRFLTAFLEHALSDLDYDVVNKSFFENTFDMEFNEVGSDRAVFYDDDGHSFDSVLFYGHEKTLFLFNLYTFIFVDILSHNYLLAGIVVFIFDLGLKAVRSSLGKNNLARKTLIDRRFLI